MQRILVVDDEPAIREMLYELLTREGYAVEQAGNGLDALRIHSKDPVDLVVLDILMPEMDGLEVCRTIKAEPVLADMKVIIITGFPEHPKLKEVAELGFTHVYYKPFDLGDIMKAVDDMLA